MTNYSFLVWLHYNLRHRGDILKLLDEMSKSQWLAADAIYAYQLDQLRNLIAYARRNVEHYREIFSKIGLADEKDITSLEDIRKIPVLTKAQIRQGLGHFTANRNDLIENQTGGSTGVPLRFYCNRSFINHFKPAANYLAYNTAGYKIGDRMGVLWGYDNDLHRLNSVQKLLNRAVYNLYEVNGFELTKKRIIDFIDSVSLYKIKFIKGYANLLSEVSRYILDHGIVFRHKIKAVFSEAERLDREHRLLIEQAFRASVLNIYGCREFGIIATECRIHNGLHINFEQVFVEVDDKQRILVTSFLNRGTVFIRYEIGDCAEKLVTEKCSCGRSSARLSRITGRESENFIAEDGRIVHGEYVTHLFYKTKHIEQFQIIQNSLSDFNLYIVSNEPPSAATEIEQIKLEMERHFKTRLNINLQFVDSIEKTRSGKQKFVISNVHPSTERILENIV